MRQLLGCHNSSVGLGKLPPSSSSSDSFFLYSSLVVCTQIHATMRTKKISIDLMLYLLFLCLSSKALSSFAADTVSANQSLSGDQTRISKDGNFSLGFFKPGNSTYFYIGIWYHKITVQTIVWVANRETPVKDKYSSFLTIQDSNLVILDESQKPIWSTNVTFTSSGPSRPVMAVLQDDGNLVLTEGSSSLSKSGTISPIWQSLITQLIHGCLVVGFLITKLQKHYRI